MTDICQPPIPVSENEDEIVHYVIEPDQQNDLWETGQEDGTELEQREGAMASLEENTYNTTESMNNEQQLNDEQHYFVPSQQSVDMQHNTSSYYPRHHIEGSPSQLEGGPGYDIITTAERNMNVLSPEQGSHQPVQTTYYHHVSQEPQQRQISIMSQNTGLLQNTGTGPEPVKSETHFSPDSKNYYLESIAPLPGTVPHITNISPSVTVVSYTPQHVPPQTISRIHSSQIYEYQKTKDVLIQPSIHQAEATLQNNPLLIPEDLKAAVMCGRVYGPDNAVYVPGEVVKHAGMQTLYDCVAVPTFETELEVFAMPTPALNTATKEVAVSMEETIKTPPVVSGTGLMKKVVQARRRMHCC